MTHWAYIAFLFVCFQSAAATLGDRTRPPKSFKHECQVCGEIIHNRMELKQHIRQHAGTVVGQPAMCCA